MIIKLATQAGNVVIRTKSKNIANPSSPSPEIRKVVKDLTDSMRHHELVGMAAPQIGKNIRVYISEIRQTKLRKGQDVKNADKLRVYINPKITWRSKKLIEGWEGCGSVAHGALFGTVKRAQSVEVVAFDENGNKFKLKAENLLARVIQHEQDHIDGILFSDKADPKTFMSSNEYLKKFSKKK